MSSAQAGLLGALSGLGQSAQQLGQTTYQDKLAERRAMLAARLQQERDDVQYGRQLARDETLYQRGIEAEQRGLENLRKELRMRIGFEKREDVTDAEGNLVGQRVTATNEFKPLGGGRGSGSGGGVGGYAKLDDYLADITKQIDADWTRLKDEGAALDADSRKFIVSTAQEVGQMLYGSGSILPPASVATNAIRAVQSGQFPNLSYNNALSAAQQELATQGKGGWFREGKPELPDAKDERVQARAYQLQEQAAGQFRQFVASMYAAPEQYGAAVDARANPPQPEKPPADLRGLLSKVEQGTNAPSLGEKTREAAGAVGEAVGGAIADTARLYGDYVLPNLPHVNYVKGLYRFYSDFTNPRGERAPDYVLNIQHATEKGMPIETRELEKATEWILKNPGKFRGSKQEREALLAELEAMLRSGKGQR